MILGPIRNARSDPPIFRAVCRDMGFNPLPKYILLESELDYMVYSRVGMSVLMPTGGLNIIKNVLS